ncbi:MAG: sugar ABC transporter permease [Firmicutes bacterium]|nr:sugar ABC transporter permease [Bacillota bacterium]
MERMLSNKKYVLFFMLPGMLFYLVFYLIPILATVQLSFTQWDGISFENLKNIGTRNYFELFTNDPVFWTGIKNTFVILLLQLAVQIPLTTILALVLDSCVKGVKAYKTTFFIPVLFSATAVGLLWSRLYDVDYGLINRIFSSLGTGYMQKWLSSSKTVVLALTAPMIWRSMGYYLLILYAGVKSIPKSYYEAALIDGCSAWQSAMKITLPLMRNAINVVVTLTAVAALREYPLIYVMTNGGPFNSSSTPAIQMYIESFLKMRFGYGSSIAVVLVIECLLISALIHKLFPDKDIQY